MKTCEFSSSKCAVLSLNSTGLPFRRVAKNFNFFEQEKSIKVEGMKRVETMFTSVTTENQDAKSSLEVMMSQFCDTHIQSNHMIKPKIIKQRNGTLKLCDSEHSLFDQSYLTP